ncbi:MAG: 3-dehydroquinate synthase [Bacteroidales bacterium]|nr:3-dehydroquinate synthase [Bacteroidales bacterium]
MNKNIFSIDIVEQLQQIIKTYPQDKIFVLADENTAKYCFPIISKAFNFDPIVIETPIGEKNKNIQTATFLWEFLSNHNADRKSLLINLGGGFITDLGGFVASTFQRGIDFINIPTTLLAQVDASIGGKNGVNLNDIKNQIGSFKYPIVNLISTTFLETLPKRQLVAGFAEVVKHALISSENEWNKIRFSNPEFLDFRFLQNIVEDSAGIKLSFVKSDPEEKGIREALNFGHTVGHALETFLTRKGVDILHGEAVAIGLIAELFLSNRVFTFDFKKLFGIAEYIATYFPSFDLHYDDYEAIYEIMKHDKKNKENKIRFSLLKDIGHIEVNQVCEKEDVFEALNFYFQVKK